MNTPTPEERAGAVIREAMDDLFQSKGQQSEIELEVRITTAIREAVAAEREACARLLKSASELWPEDPQIRCVLRAYAAAILARGQP